MIPIVLRQRLPFTTLSLTYNGMTLTLENVLLDTGSASTIIATDSVASIGLKPFPDDPIHEVFGVGGSEAVVEKIVPVIRIDGSTLRDFTIELGGMDYGFALDGIAGLDLLLAVHANIDLDALELYATPNI